MDENSFVVRHSQSRGDFGTVFPVKVTDDSTYFVTALHVVNDKAGDTLTVANQPFEVTSSSNRELDLAILRVRKRLKLSPLPLRKGGHVGIQFYGFGARFFAKGPIVKQFSGTLGIEEFIDDNILVWPLLLDEGDTVEPGSSGAPIFAASDDRVIAVATWRSGENKGFAIAIKALADVWNEDEFGTLPFDTGSRKTITCIGREAELRKLQNALHSVTQASEGTEMPLAVCVVGEQGSGRSNLLDFWLSNAIRSYWSTYGCLTK